MKARHLPENPKERDWNIGKRYALSRLENILGQTSLIKKVIDPAFPTF
jgi:hypothetical protein